MVKKGLKKRGASMHTMPSPELQPEAAAVPQSTANVPDKTLSHSILEELSTGQASVLTNIVTGVMDIVIHDKNVAELNIPLSAKIVLAASTLIASHNSRSNANLFFPEFQSKAPLTAQGDTSEDTSTASEVSNPQSDVVNDSGDSSEITEPNNDLTKQPVTLTSDEEAVKMEKDAVNEKLKETPKRKKRNRTRRRSRQVFEEAPALNASLQKNAEDEVIFKLPRNVEKPLEVKVQTKEQVSMKNDTPNDNLDFSDTHLASTPTNKTPPNKESESDHFSKTGSDPRKKKWKLRRNVNSKVKVSLKFDEPNTNELIPKIASTKLESIQEDVEMEGELEYLKTDAEFTPNSSQQTGDLKTEDQASIVNAPNKDDQNNVPFEVLVNTYVTQVVQCAKECAIQQKADDKFNFSPQRITRLAANETDESKIETVEDDRTPTNDQIKHAVGNEDNHNLATKETIEEAAAEISKELITSEDKLKENQASIVTAPNKDDQNNVPFEVLVNTYVTQVVQCAKQCGIQQTADDKFNFSPQSITRHTANETDESKTETVEDARTPINDQIKHAVGNEENHNLAVKELIEEVVAEISKELITSKDKPKENQASIVTAPNKDDQNNVSLEVLENTNVTQVVQCEKQDSIQQKAGITRLTANETDESKIETAKDAQTPTNDEISEIEPKQIKHAVGNEENNNLVMKETTEEAAAEISKELITSKDKPEEITKDEKLIVFDLITPISKESHQITLVEKGKLNVPPVTTIKSNAWEKTTKKNILPTMSLAAINATEIFKKANRAYNEAKPRIPQPNPSHDETKPATKNPTSNIPGEATTGKKSDKVSATQKIDENKNNSKPCGAEGPKSPTKVNKNLTLPEKYFVVENTKEKPPKKSSFQTETVKDSTESPNYCESQKQPNASNSIPVISLLNPEISYMFNPNEKHPLVTAWTLWFYEKKSGNWLDNLKEIASFDTGEDLWLLYNHLLLPSELPLGWDFCIFRSGIKPTWEDPKNRQGGKWVISFYPPDEGDLINRRWLDTLFFMVSDITPGYKEVCGAVLSVRKGVDKFAIWTTNSNHSQTNMIIGHDFKQMLNAEYAKCTYHVHADTAQRSKKHIHHI